MFGEDRIFPSQSAIPIIMKSQATLRQIIRPTLATRLLAMAVVATLASSGGALAAGNAGRETPPVPDFTQGGAIPAGANHDWTLGATGARGWIYCDKMVTTDARQIAITKVDKGSPAEGTLAVGDVILGVGGKPFAYDPRTELGKALTVAESDAGGGNLAITRWRAGKTEEVVVKLPVLGSYSATAPFDCSKSKRILEQGARRLPKKWRNPRMKRIPSCVPSMRSPC